ncbi:MAG: arylsulfatase [Planctomycetota bacterium]
MRLVVLAVVLPVAFARAQDPAAHRPNVIVVMTDDQGFGDFGCAGNPVIHTPHLDELAAHSARLSNFYVSPVCTPTRAALMTGRWCQRTRAFDTYIGRAMMDPGEVTIAEMLHDAGYATGIFGKWHLGDCYPLRAVDQGFEEALVIRGGGIGQPSDPPGGEGRYTDPILFHNGVAEPSVGWCTDLFFDGAMNFIAKCNEQRRPFFCYLPTNAPHGPWRDVPEAPYRRYLAEGVAPARFPETAGAPAPAKLDEDILARTYAMIENVDDNIGRLIERLEKLGCLDDTLILFLCDNGPEGRRWLAGYRGAKSQVYEGGIRSPLWAYWPGHLRPGVASDRIAAHVDLMPTILDACGVTVPQGLRLDGRSLWPLLTEKDADWSDRELVIQANRGDAPLRYHNFALRTQRWKLVNATGFDRELDAPPPFAPELYDMEADPYELHDVAKDHPDLVADLRKRYDAWFDDIAATRPDPFSPPRIFVGSDAEQVTVLTRQDWRRTPETQGWGAQGSWSIDVRTAGRYGITVRTPARRHARIGTFHCGTTAQDFTFDVGAPEARFEVELHEGPASLRVDLRDDDGSFGAHQVELHRTSR